MSKDVAAYYEDKMILEPENVEVWKFCRGFGYGTIKLSPEQVQAIQDGKLVAITTPAESFFTFIVANDTEIKEVEKWEEWRDRTQPKPY